MAGISINANEKVFAADDWKRNWQDSIAVRISALVLWITVPAVVIATLIFLRSAEDTLRVNFTNQADLLAFRVGNALLYAPDTDDLRFRDALLTIANDAGFHAVRITIDGDEIMVEEPLADQETIMRGIPAILPNSPGVARTIQVSGYHTPFHVLVQKQREDTLMVIILALTVFGLFLMWAIRAIAHRPLQILVEATRQVSEGNTRLRLSTTNEDEFGTLGRFFNKMLDTLMEHQTKVEDALAEAENANRAKSVFLAHMSHELRTPLNAIIGYSDMLAEEAIEMGQEAAVPDLQKIKIAGKHLLDLINNILDISKIEAGKMELFVETIDVQSMLQDIVATVQPLIDRNSNLLRIETGEHVGSMRADVTKLRQAMLNLLSNASKFTDHGVVTLRVERDMRVDPTHIRFTVSDTGVGMSESQQRAAFQAFSQGDVSITRTYGGTGLGLAISRHYVQLMGGEISVRSAPDMGTTFTITLPVECRGQDKNPLLSAVLKQRNVA